jgi:diadenosine tetraphosphate (Ap4A) HIT family hydrolase
VSSRQRNIACRAFNVPDAAWRELRAHAQRSTHPLREDFAPDHFNYAFLQHQDRYVHLHLIPRYATERFEDTDYPTHYAAPGPERHRLPSVLTL